MGRVRFPKYTYTPPISMCGSVPSPDNGHCPERDAHGEEAVDDVAQHRLHLRVRHGGLVQRVEVQRGGVLGGKEENVQRKGVAACKTNFAGPKRENQVRLVNLLPFMHSQKIHRKIW